MAVPSIDHRPVGLIVAFDADTGDVLHVLEKFVETADGKCQHAAEISRDECEEIRGDAARSHPRRKVDVIIAPAELGQRENEPPVRYHVDPMTRKLRAEPECDLRVGVRRLALQR